MEEEEERKSWEEELCIIIITSKDPNHHHLINVNKLVNIPGSSTFTAAPARYSRKMGL